MLKIFKCNKGVTLVELLVVLALLGIVLALGYQFFGFGTKAFSRGELRSNVQRDIRMTSEYITQQLRFADEVVLNPPTPMVNEYHYIFLREDGSIIHRTVAGDQKILIDSSIDGINYDLRFSKSYDEPRLLEFKIEGAEVDYSHDSKVNVKNLGSAIDDSNLEPGNSHATVIRYTIPGTPIWEYISAQMRFWRDFIRDYYENVLDTADAGVAMDATFIDTGELGVTIGGSAHYGGGMLFKDIEPYLGDIPGASIDNYTITIDAQDVVGRGWGVLINGYTYTDGDGKIKDHGYMFQFDPGARGFVLRRINGGSHPWNTDDGERANVGAVNHPNDNIDAETNNNWGCEQFKYATTIYAPEHISNDNFKFRTYPDSYYNQNANDNIRVVGREFGEPDLGDSHLSADWRKRYKTIINVTSIEKDGLTQLMLKVVLEDMNGNQSNPMYYGDFVTYETTGEVKETFKGQPLDFKVPWGDNWDGEGSVIGLRSWPDIGQDHSTNFFGIELEPGIDSWW